MPRRGLPVEQRQLVEIARALRSAPASYPRRADRVARGEGDRAAVRADAPLKASGVTIPLHLAPPRGGLRVCDRATVLATGGMVPDAASPLPIDRPGRGDGGRRARHARCRAAGAAAPRRPRRRLAVRARGRQRRSATSTRRLRSRGECVGLFGLRGLGQRGDRRRRSRAARADAGNVRSTGRALPAGQGRPRRSPAASATCRRTGTRAASCRRSASRRTSRCDLERAVRRPARVARAAPRRRRRDRDARRSWRLGASSPSTSSRAATSRRWSMAARWRRALAARRRQPDRGRRHRLEGGAVRASSRGDARTDGVLLVSDDLDELLVCDRVLVIFAGEHRSRSSVASGSETRMVAAIEGFEAVTAPRRRRRAPAAPARPRRRLLHRYVATSSR